MKPPQTIDLHLLFNGAKDQLIGEFSYKIWKYMETQFHATERTDLDNLYYDIQDKIESLIDERRQTK